MFLGLRVNRKPSEGLRRPLEPKKRKPNNPVVWWAWPGVVRRQGTYGTRNHIDLGLPDWDPRCLKSQFFVEFTIETSKFNR